MNRRLNHRHTGISHSRISSLIKSNNGNDGFTNDNNNESADRLSTSNDSKPTEDMAIESKPILVVGATGEIGQIVTRELLDNDIPTRIFVRNGTKVDELFGSHIHSSDTKAKTTETTKMNQKLQVVIGDLMNIQKMEEAVKGCSSIISVSGTKRYSKILDFLPWRLFRFDVSSWCHDETHPYYMSYLSQINLAKVAGKHQISSSNGNGGIVRLTVLSTGLSVFNPISIIFSAILSLSSRYHYAAERDMYRECASHGIPFTALRPGGFRNDIRNTNTTFLQIDSSGRLPPPSSIGKADLAALAVEAVKSSLYNKKKNMSRVLAIRWCGEDLKPKAQGKMEDGCINAAACFRKLSKEEEDEELKTIGDADNHNSSFQLDYPNKPYALAVSCFVYPFAAIAMKFIFRMSLWMISKVK